jgi:hydroxyacylglutathione hydrolase
MGIDAEHRDLVMIEVVQIPALNDNYIYLVRDSSGATAVVDPGVAEPVLAAAAARGWTITDIWNTHWHRDHTDGNLAVKAATGATITGPAAEAAKIAGIDRTVVEGDAVRLGDSRFAVLDVGGHTLGHNAYYAAAAATLFCGDTLFALGCGRLFEGTPAQMHASLSKLMALPDDTLVYCAHEYTAANARFALTIEPGNAALQQRAADVARLRADALPTVPSTIGDERATNPFVRVSDLAEFTARRAAKDSFRG